MACALIIHKPSILPPSILLLNRPRSSKSVRLNSEPAVRYFDSSKSIFKADSKMAPSCDYRSSVSSSAMDVTSYFSSKCTIGTLNSDVYYPSDAVVKCKFYFKGMKILFKRIFCTARNFLAIFSKIPKNVLKFVKICKKLLRSQNFLIKFPNIY